MSAAIMSDVFNSVLLMLLVENRVQRSEHIVMGTSGTLLDWILKKKVATYLSVIHICQF